MSRTRAGFTEPADVPLPSPTAAAPGTPEKVEALARRAERGETLFHPRDACVIEDPRGNGPAAIKPDPVVPRLPRVFPAPWTNSDHGRRIW